MDLAVEGEDGRTVSVDVRQLVIAGYTGADGAAVQAHVDELARLGIAPPPSVPAYWLVPTTLLGVDGHIEVASAQSSGEVEPVLVCAEDGWYVGVGSDHTDRELEHVDIGRSKRVCPKVMGRAVLPYDYVRKHRDRIQLRSWTLRDGRSTLYQSGQLNLLLPVEEILEQLPPEADVGPGLVVFLGTVPMVAGEFVFADGYEMQLSNHDDDRTIRCTYTVGQRRDR